jgi:putative membrane protein
MMNYYGYGYGGWGIFGFLWMTLCGALIIIGIIVLVRWLGHGWHDHGHSALDILKERYAKGEIDKKEFEEKKRDLEV